MYATRAWWIGLAACLLASCGGGGDDGGGAGGGPPPPDLSANLTAPASVTPDASYDYGVTVSVSGGSAQNVGTTLTLPASVVITAVSGGGTASGNTVTWPAVATLAAGSPISQTVSVIAPAVGPLDATLSATTTSAESSTGNNASTRRTVLGFDAIATLQGEAPGDAFGYVADSLGDIDGDSVEDFIVGAAFNDAGGNDAGRAYVYSGAGAALLFTVSGQAAGENFGWSVAAAGDVDGDGTGDFVVGAPSVGAGNARVFSGVTGALLHTLAGTSAGSRFGSIVAGIGDTNGDGRADLLIGAQNTAGVGQAFVVSGMDGTNIRSHSGPAGSSYGFGAGALGDVSGDGVPDYAIGGGTTGSSGFVEARSGDDGSLLYSVPALATSVQLGFVWIDSVGDINGDTRPDFFVADINDSGNRGRGILVSGSDGAVVHSIAGSTASEFFGISRNGGHDADGDGVPDIFVAGYHNSDGATRAGKGYVYSGATGDLIRTMTNTIAGDTIGYDAVQLGDIDGDGLVDYLLSGDIEQGTTGRGRVYLIRGTALP
ncbi:MAG: hypothetical protein RLN69_09975 [Woeseiaceae bacterium]